MHQKVVYMLTNELTECNKWLVRLVQRKTFNTIRVSEIVQVDKGVVLIVINLQVTLERRGLPQAFLSLHQ